MYTISRNELYTILRNTHLIKRWEEVIFYDPTLREDELTDKQKERFLHWNNKSYWIKLREKNTSTNKNHVNLEKARFYRIINNHSDKIQEKITILLAEKLRNFDRLSKQYPSDINRNFNTLCIESTILKRPEPSFVCSVTGIDISDQRSGSRFVSEAKVRSIHHSDKQKFYELAFEFGPQDSHDLTLDKLGYFIAHNVRNRDSNQRQRIQRSNMRYKHTLFDINQFLVSQN